ncbi:MAG TPA: hypothetical protein VF792_08340 [Ktedonobacterales bacterium]
MPETGTPYARYSRVTTRRGTLRPLNCPLEPELMVAEFSGELPPDVAQAVREHIAICETCGAHAASLRTPYNLLSSLGAAPVPYVPDLRESVRVTVASEERWRTPLRKLGEMSRFGLLAVVLGAVLIGLVAFLLQGGLQNIGAFHTSRTTNSLTKVLPAAPSGVIFAETNKTLSLNGDLGQSWTVAEVIVADQHTGKVLRSLPDSGAQLSIASTSSEPVAIVTDGATIYELTAPQTLGGQAIVAINASNGTTRFITPITGVKGNSLPGGAQAQSLMLSPDGQTLYVGIGGSDSQLLSVRAVAISSTAGKVTMEYSPTTVTSAPGPAPASSLPASAFPSQTPTIDLSHLTFTEAAQGAVVVSPDGQWLFDALVAGNGQGPKYVVVRRFSVANGQTAQALALTGQFHGARLAVSRTSTVPQLYLVAGSPGATVYVMDTTTKGPTLLGDIALGGPAVANGTVLDDSISLSPTVTGGRLYVSEDTTSPDGVVTAHERWFVDTQGMGVIASDSEVTPVGSLMANASTSQSAKVLALVNGQIEINAQDFSGYWTPWLKSSDNGAIIQLISSIG